MAKENAFYFTHDYNTRNDSKIKNLLSVHGFLGYGLFWAIIEDLYNNANALPLNCKVIAFDLRTKEKTIHSIIHDFDLFVIEKNIFGSRSVQRRLEDRDAKSIKARESAFKRWGNDANAKQSQSAPNAIKEIKVKEIKVKENKVNKIKNKEGEVLNKIESLEVGINDPFFEIWQRWVKYKKDQHKFKYASKDSEETAKKQLLKLCDGNPDIANQILDQSIGSGYKGFFELKATPKTEMSKNDKNMESTINAINHLQNKYKNQI